MAAGRALHRGLHAVAFHGLDEEAHGLGRVRLRGGDGFFQREVNVLQIISVRDRNNVPTERAHRLQAGLHRERIFRDAAGELGVVVGNNHHERVHLALGGEAGDGGEGFLGFAFHARAVADDAEGHAVALREFVADSQPLRLRQR